MKCYRIYPPPAFLRSFPHETRAKFVSESIRSSRTRTRCPIHLSFCTHVPASSAGGEGFLTCRRRLDVVGGRKGRGVTAERWFGHDKAIYGWGWGMCQIRFSEIRYVLNRIREEATRRFSDKFNVPRHESHIDPNTLRPYYIHSRPT